MPMGVEELGRLADMFGELSLSTDNFYFAEAEQAIRELIAIKEARPLIFATMNGVQFCEVSYTQLDAERYAGYRQKQSDLSGDFNSFVVVPLIRKPG